MKNLVQDLFDRYELFFNQALSGDADMEELASFYSEEFIGAAPAGVRAGKNDDQFRADMTMAYEQYRATGTRDMKIRSISLSAIDELHCVADVAWTATYARKGKTDVIISFHVHYLVQVRDEDPRIFGWVSGDEQGLLKQHGII